MTLEKQIWITEERLDYARRYGASQDRIDTILDRLQELYQELHDRELIDSIMQRYELYE